MDSNPIYTQAQVDRIVEESLRYGMNKVLHPEAFDNGNVQTEGVCVTNAEMSSDPREPVEFCGNSNYNCPVGQLLADLSDTLADIKAALADAGPHHLDNDIDELSNTRILPKEGESSMARLRGRLNLNQETIMIGAANVQALIEKVAAMVAESMKNEDAGRKQEIPTFSEYAGTWLENYCRHKVENTTFVGYQSYLNAHLYKAFGSLRLNEITVTRLQEFINERSELTIKSVKNFMKLLSLILQAAIEDGYITTDVTRSKKLVFANKESSERVPLTEEQLKEVISDIRKLKPNDQLLLALLIYTGARRGEIIGMKAMDIDPDKQLIHFVRQVRYAGQNQGEVVDYLKMHKKKKDVPILDQLRPYLPLDGKDRYLFGDGVHPWTQQQFRNAWTRICKTINLYGATPHVLRHTFLTYVNNHGADPKTLQTLAGHSSAQFTLSRYVHPQTAQLQRVGHQISTSFDQL